MKLTRFIFLGGTVLLFAPHFAKVAGSPHCVRYDESVGWLEVPLFRAVEFRPTSGPAKEMMERVNGAYMPLPFYSEITAEIYYLDRERCAENSN